MGAKFNGKGITMLHAIRITNAALVVPALKATGWRFPKTYRHGVTRWHRAVYACVDTVQANIWAGLDKTL